MEAIESTNATNDEGLDIHVRSISPDKREYIEIFCHEVNDNIKDIISFIKSRQGQLDGQIDDRKFVIPYTDIYYIEGVDNKVFIYCKDQVYETKYKLYELEEKLGSGKFLRISKSTIVHLMKVKAIKPALNGRFIAVLQNGEEVIISRKYVPELKKILMGEKRNDR